jgi:hypothetical protein
VELDLDLLDGRVVAESYIMTRVGESVPGDYRKTPDRPTYLTSIAGLDDGSITIHTYDLASQTNGLGFVLCQTGGVDAG